MSGSVFVYTTDSSWVSNGRHSGHRYHWPSDRDEALAACGRHVLDDSTGGLPAYDVPDHMRCRRPACRKRFAELFGGET